MEAVGTCARCGNYLCEVCRTRWRNLVLCAACVDRALESREANPEQSRAHLRQASLSLVLGGLAWAVSFLAWMVLILVVGAGARGAAGLVVLAGLVLLADTIPAALGVGQAVAALRTRGNHMIMATVGLILSGLYIGILVGLFSFSVWQNS
jgi:hypothetical protein